MKLLPLNMQESSLDGWPPESSPVWILTVEVLRPRDVSPNCWPPDRSPNWTAWCRTAVQTVSAYSSNFDGLPNRGMVVA